MPEDERRQLIHLLTKFNGKKVRVMEAMGITAPTLDRKLKLYGINYKLFKPTKKKKTSTTASK
ncbi:MAG: hypothetical protein BHV67_06165 [Bacteroidales bacterium 43_36]|nr:MAG: hypothetical protein BHV67_06165 [Bacteroidales bacterium 43_36]